MKVLLLLTFAFLFGTNCFAQNMNNVQFPMMVKTSARKEIRIPNILGFQTLKCDFHMHTVFSDGVVLLKWKNGGCKSLPSLGWPILECIFAAKTLVWWCLYWAANCTLPKKSLHLSLRFTVSCTWQGSSWTAIWATAMGQGWLWVLACYFRSSQTVQWAGWEPSAHWSNCRHFSFGLKNLSEQKGSGLHHYIIPVPRTSEFRFYYFLRKTAPARSSHLPREIIGYQLFPDREYWPVVFRRYRSTNWSNSTSTRRNVSFVKSRISFCNNQIMIFCYQFNSNLLIFRLIYLLIKRQTL